jgi:hypothetical protein
MAAKKLIRITADDAGLNVEQDRIILSLAQEGKISGVSFMVNMMPKPASVEEFLSIPGLSIGLHLNLTDGRPVSPVTSVSSLVDEGGGFLGPHSFVHRWLSGRLKSMPILTEVMCQVIRFKTIFGRIDHVDSHRHVHRFPIVARSLAVALCSEPTPPRVRNLSRCIIASNGKGTWSSRLNFLLKDIKRPLGTLLKKGANRVFVKTGLPQERGLLTPWPPIHSGASDAAFHWATVFQTAPVGHWEVNFHPGWQASERALLQDEQFNAAWCFTLGDKQSSQG